MSIKSLLAKPAHAVERRVDRLLTWISPPKQGTPEIKPYIGYGSPQGLIIRGRVLSGVVSSTSSANQSVFRNAWQMIRLFMTDEVAGIRVSIPGTDVAGATDEEGYFTLKLKGDFAPGWHDITVEAAGAEAIVPVKVTDPDADFLVISDIDDTMMETGAYSIWRSVWTTLTGNAMTRRIFPDAVDLMDTLSDGGRNPVFYVSSSPWNLHGFLTQVFDRHMLERGPMFLRDLGIDDSKFFSDSHGDHKGISIDTIMAANPGLPCVLIGDTGQHDADVYLAAAERYPNRVVSVILRTPGPSLDAADRVIIARLREEMELPVYVGADYSELIGQMDAALMEELPTSDNVVTPLRPRSTITV